MKKTTAFLIIACMLLGVTTHAQQITFSKKNVTIDELGKVIEEKTDYTLFYKREYLPRLKSVTIRVTKASLGHLLDEYFKYQPFKYTFIDNVITIIPRESPPQVSPVVNIKGRISNEQGDPIPGATITVKGSSQQTSTNENGAFELTGVNEVNLNIVITCVNYELKEVNYQGEPELDIQLKEHVSELSPVVSTGYQNISKAKLPGSIVNINNELVNRRVSTNILDRLEGITSGLIFNKNINSNANQSAISIRSRSTIFANPNPLIVIDNFPYNGDINNINPNDVENITVLKDADAASIWGAYAGNGVIVITTKKGRYNQPLKISFNSSVNIGQKPDLYYKPTLNSSDYIDVEQYLFNQGFYNGVINNPAHALISPVVEILAKQRNGDISATEANEQLDVLRGQDKRKDLQKYIYRPAVNQQYALSANGGSNYNTYYFLLGYDKNLQNLTKNQFDRFNVTAKNSFSWLNRKLELNTGIIFSETNQRNNNPGDVYINYPYLKLADANGNPVAVPIDLRQSYKDTAGAGILQDWNFRPLDEIRLADNNTQTTDYRINADAKYIFFKGFDATFLYQYNKGFVEQENYHSQQTYYTRNLINRFTEVDSGSITRNVPLGAIWDHAITRQEAQNIRGQLNFNRSWYNKRQTKNHAITALAGAEVRNLKGQIDAIRLYGFNKDRQTSAAVDYEKAFPLYNDPTALSKIDYKTKNISTTDRYISYYLNAKYIYQNRYILSVSARKDESNLFGVSANQKGVPLWSVGVSWDISRESFYHVSWLPYLKLRATNGYNGNVDKTVTAYTTAAINDNTNIWGAVTNTIINPPNPSLRWEKNHMINVGVDFAAKNNIIEGSVEYYIRKGTDLIGNSPLDPTSGNTTFRGNTADMKGKGVDIVLRTRNLNTQIRWNTTVLFSYAGDKVTSYKVPQAAIWYYCEPQYISPVAGNPLYSLYTVKWMGLDDKGNPQGFLNGRISTDYNIIYNSSDISNLIYKGPVNPPYFGSIRNTFGWKQLEFSFTVSWKWGYYFRRSSIHYANLFRGSQSGHPDYEQRWQQPGDETKTNVPAMKYPANSQRDWFYTYSDILVEKGDHIRLQDIQISYDLNKSRIKKLPMQLLHFYVYANNIGILWKANHAGIDPDYVSEIPNPRTVAAGVKIDF